jgi:hypothetical protein
MKWPFVLRTAHDAEVAALKAEIDRQRACRDHLAEERDSYRASARTTARQFAQADADNRRLEGEVTELGKRLKQLADQQPAPLSDDDRRAVENWEARAKTHDAWTAPADLEKRPVDGASGRPQHPAVELRRALDRCRALEARLTTAEGRRGVRT